MRIPCSGCANRKWKAQRSTSIFLVFVSMFWDQALAQVLNNDIVCLQGLKSQLKSTDGTLFSNWTGSNFPCNSSSPSSYRGIECSNSRVQTIQLPGLGLTGSLSPNLSACANLLKLDLSENSLTGSLPLQLGLLGNIVTMNLSYNSLSGAIPQELENCTYLSVIDLAHNQLSGAIPEGLASLQKLQTFDVSYNNLNGAVPTGLANTSNGAPRFNSSSFEGNSGLYGYPLPAANNVHGLSVAAIVGLGFGSGLLSLILSFTAVCLWLRVTEQRNAAEEGKISQLMPDYD